MDDTEKKELRKKYIWYEKKSAFRELYLKRVLRNHLFLKYIHKEPVLWYYANRSTMSCKKANEYIASLIEADKPFMVSRFGYTECMVISQVMRARLFGYAKENNAVFNEWFKLLYTGAGFFPFESELTEQFTDLLVGESIGQIDLMGTWYIPMEEFWVNEYMKNSKSTQLLSLEPWLSDNPWSAALEGKKVLIVHPFEKTIRSQYAKREKIFPGTDILPKFDLITYKAIQTIAGEKDERFSNWFEALDYMFNEIKNIEFDIAIIGCGAYGMPLAAKLKKAGKKVIHLGGATQLMFGIRGRRWDDNYPSKIATLFNENWVYPDKDEIPGEASVVEGGCYWK